MFNLISSVISWALFLGVCGGLVDATIAMRNEAVKAHQIGLISLSQLNRNLHGRETHPIPGASPGLHVSKAHKKDVNDVESNKASKQSPIDSTDRTKR